MKDPLGKAATTIADDEGRVQQPARHAVLKIIVVVLGAVMAVLAVIVFSTLVLRAVKPSSPGTGPARQDPAPANRAIALPVGAQIVSTSAGEGRIIVVYEAAGRRVAMVLDAQTLATIGTIAPQMP
jgi:hypothetical protein